MEKPKRRTLTRPGLGAVGGSGLHPKQASPTMPPLSGVRGTGEGEEAAWADKISGSRTRTSRPPIRVDEVGDLAVAIAAKRGRDSRALTPAPRVLKTRSELSGAPIDHRDAFVLSLVDGKTSVEGVVDMAAMPDGEVVAILERLAALGIVSLPSDPRETTTR